MAKNSPNPINDGYERRDGAQKTTSGKPVPVSYTHLDVYKRQLQS